LRHRQAARSKATRAARICGKRSLPRPVVRDGRARVRARRGSAIAAGSGASEDGPDEEGVASRRPTPVPAACAPDAARCARARPAPAAATPAAAPAVIGAMRQVCEVAQQYPARAAAAGRANRCERTASAVRPGTASTTLRGVVQRPTVARRRVRRRPCRGRAKQRARRRDSAFATLSPCSEAFAREVGRAVERDIRRGSRVGVGAISRPVLRAATHRNQKQGARAAGRRFPRRQG